MNTEALIVWGLFLIVIFYFLGRVIVTILKHLSFVAVGFASLATIALSPLLILFLGFKGFKEVLARVSGKKRIVNNTQSEEESTKDDNKKEA